MPESERRAIPLVWIVASVATMLVLGAVVAAIMAYRAFFNTSSVAFVTWHVPMTSGSLVFNREGVSFQRSPKFSKHGIDDVRKHVEMLMKSRRSSLDIYTDETYSTRLTLMLADPGIRARFLLDSGLHAGFESKLRSIFDALGESPAKVESVGSGFTWLEYRVDGSPEEVSRVIERVLLEAYGVSPDAGLYFQIDD